MFCVSFYNAHNYITPTYKLYCHSNLINIALIIFLDFSITYYLTRNQVTPVKPIQKNNLENTSNDLNANTTTNTNEMKSDNVEGLVHM